MFNPNYLHPFSFCGQLNYNRWYTISVEYQRCREKELITYFLSMKILVDDIRDTILSYLYQNAWVMEIFIIFSEQAMRFRNLYK